MSSSEPDLGWELKVLLHNIGDCRKHLRISFIASRKDNADVESCHVMLLVGHMLNRIRCWGHACNVGKAPALMPWAHPVDYCMKPKAGSDGLLV